MQVPKLFLYGVFFYTVIGLVIFSESGQAVTRSWNVSSGDWNTAANWNPVGVPTSGDTANIQNGGQSTLTANGNAAVLNIGGSSGMTLQAPGVLETNSITGVGTTAQFFFSGGVLKALSDNLNFITGFSQAK